MNEFPIVTLSGQRLPGFTQMMIKSKSNTTRNLIRLCAVLFSCAVLVHSKAQLPTEAQVAPPQSVNTLSNGSPPNVTSTASPPSVTIPAVTSQGSSDRSAPSVQNAPSARDTHAKAVNHKSLKKNSKSKLFHQATNGQQSSAKVNKKTEPTQAHIAQKSLQAPEKEAPTSNPSTTPYSIPALTTPLVLQPLVSAPAQLTPQAPTSSSALSSSAATQGLPPVINRDITSNPETTPNTVLNRPKASAPNDASASMSAQDSSGSLPSALAPVPVSTTPTSSETKATPTSPPSSWIGTFIDTLINAAPFGEKSQPSEAKDAPTPKGESPAATNPSGFPNLLGPNPSPLYTPGSKFSTPINPASPITTGERNTTGDNALLDMAQAFKRGDKKRLSSTLPYALGHPLEPWAAYWELRARLDEANYSEVREFLKRYAGTYQEDRMRNDWLLMVGGRREWDTLLDEYPYFRMRDDRELQCYYLLAQYIQLGPKAQADTVQLVLQNWHALRDSDDGCMLAVDRLQDDHKISDLEVWRKVRLATEFNQAKLAKNALKIIEPKYLPELEAIFKSPARFLSQPIDAPSRSTDELIVVALSKLSASDPQEAVHQLQTRWISHLSPEARTWVWATAGREAALKGDPRALMYFEHTSVDKDIADDELLAWKVRVALRMDTKPRWEWVEPAINAMSEAAQKDPTWVYWRARALLQRKPLTPEHTQEAQTLLQSVAGVKGFYEQLALEELGKKITLPARPEPPNAQEIGAIKANPSLRRALYALNLGLRSEGTREWNYATTLVDNSGRVGGMSDRMLLAAATYACELEVWDRCVNAADKSKIIDYYLRFPMPFKDLVIYRTREINLDPAYVYGLIRQESRFVMSAKSSVGASGLMQIMPKTAQWTAKKIGLLNFRPENLASREVNVAIGTGYLKLVLDSFDGSMPMAAAAYNAGPSRVRHWQEGSVVEGAIWAESIPFNETRDYVKKVLSNTVNYQAIITSEAQSLKFAMGMIAPQDTAKAILENADLP